MNAFLSDAIFDPIQIPLDRWFADFINWLTLNYRPTFQAMKVPIEVILQNVDSFLQWLPPLVFIVLLALFAWRVAGRRIGLFTVAAFVLIGMIGLWSLTMTTLSMVIASVLVCMVMGIPLGILAARSDRFRATLRPVLDVMQTTPAFVYLVPVVMLFSIGTVAGVIATIIFALPPLIRLTDLGIRQVPEDVIEAAEAFGSSEREILVKVRLPLALPSIMAGINQTIMLALSMVVIAALIGAGGLGRPVVEGLNALRIGVAGIGGLAIVLLAIVLDRLTQALGEGRQRRSAE
ncbi:MAG: proline/glycine betaine ABC transporter permease [Trueperaceae bacterium]|nr:MAG: proline/glycine betaine ABC transporter permease [Trueperaceae bacterium]